MIVLRIETAITLGTGCSVVVVIGFVDCEAELTATMTPNVSQLVCEIFKG